MIKEITATNFMAFKQLHYVCSKLNLLTGVNGAGKSSFLKLLSLAHKMNCEQGSSVTCKSISYDDVRYCYAPTGDDVSFSFVFCEEGQNQTIGSVAFDISKEENGDGICLKWKKDDDINMGAIRFLPPYRDKPRNNMRTYVSIDHLCIYLAFTDLYGRETILDQTGSRRQGNKFRIVTSDRHCYLVGTNAMPVGNDANDVVEIEREIRGIRDIWVDVPDEEQVMLISKVNEWLDRLSPGTSVCIQQYCSSFVDKTGHVFKPQNASWGLNYALPILVAVLVATPDDVLVIQNPEAFLHPRAQSVMGELFASAAARSVQLFVETHSEYIINAVRLAVKNQQLPPEDVNIAVFRRMGVFNLNKDGSNNESPSSEYSQEDDVKVRTGGELSDYPNDFMEEWANQLAELV